MAKLPSGKKAKPSPSPAPPIPRSAAPARPVANASSTKNNSLSQPSANSKGATVKTTLGTPAPVKAATKISSPPPAIPAIPVVIAPMKALSLPAPSLGKTAKPASKSSAPSPKAAPEPVAMKASKPGAKPSLSSPKIAPEPAAPAAASAPDALRKGPAGKPAQIDLTSRPVSPPKISAPRVKAKSPKAATPARGRSAKKILFVTSECSPLAQSGGLGDAVAGLSKALGHRGHEVRIVMPLYGFLDRVRHGITFARSCCVHFGEGEEIWVGIFEGKLDGEVPIWFIDYARYFGGNDLYGRPDDAYRFGVLSKAALQICKDTGFIPDIAHVHDWMSSMVPVFLKTWDRVLSPLSKTASVLTIHNIGYQGKYDPAVLRFYGLGADYMRPDRLEDFGAVNLLKAGIQYADAITTVSPTYAREIREPVGGMGLAPYLNDRAGHLFGILNGVDTEIWNPETDKYLPARYSRKNLAGKAACKRALQKRFGLVENPKIPIFAMVSRFAPQKGFDLLRGALPQALRDMVMQVVALGTGDPVTENFFRWLSDAYPGRANAHIGFVPELAHLIEAGSDFFVMPSIYEPCGLNQLYSSLYGALPVVRATGGLDDTVENYNEATGRGTGFKFWEISDRAVYFTLGWAVSTWFDRPHHYKAMQQQGMAHDFSWEASAREYEKVYEHAIASRSAL